jgi:hypothetical protein
MPRPRVIPEWKRAWRWFSVNIPIALASATGYWMGLDEAAQKDLLSMLHLDHPGWLVIAGCCATAIGRIINQGSK